jgi:hypothetical protein
VKMWPWRKPAKAIFKGMGFRLAQEGEFARLGAMAGAQAV